MEVGENPSRTGQPPQNLARCDLGSEFRTPSTSAFPNVALKGNVDPAPLMEAGENPSISGQVASQGSAEPAPLKVAGKIGFRTRKVAS